MIDFVNKHLIGILKSNTHTPLPLSNIYSLISNEQLYWIYFSQDTTIGILHFCIFNLQIIN